MKEISGVLLTQAVRSKVRSGSMIPNTLAILLCLVSAVMGIRSLLEGNSRVRAASHKENGGERLDPPTMNLTGLITSGHAPARFRPSEDHVWRENQSRNNGKGGAGTAPTFYRALSLDEIAQREVLRHAPMESSKAARQTQVVMTLP